MRITIDFYGVFAFLLFVIVQTALIAYAGNPYILTIWLTGEVCKVMLLMYIWGTAKVKKDS